ncbi:MAG: hypothetical protein SFU87_18390 [Chitinophagaceae bacterium]|nr:hypothetical protein [Chitinophagaceae bacterium]
MKKLLLIATAASLLALTSCLDTEEKISINNDDSGSYTLTMDMGQLLTFAKTMGAGKDKEGKLPEKKDSIIYFKGIVDTSTVLTVQEKEMLRNGTLHIKLDEEAAEMKFVINLPFKNISGLPYLKENFMAAMDKIKVMDKVDPTKKQNPDGESTGEEIPAENKPSSKSLNPMQSAYTFSAVKGKISNKLTDRSAFDNLVKNDSSLQMMQQLTGMMGEMKYRTVIVLPKAAKSFKGNNAEASADKKTITFKNSLTDMMGKAEAAEYEVEY